MSKFGIELELCLHMINETLQSKENLLKILNNHNFPSLSTDEQHNWKKYDIDYKNQDEFLYSSWFITEDESVECDFKKKYHYCVQHGKKILCDEKYEFLPIEMVSPIFLESEIYKVVGECQNLLNDDIIYLINESQGFHVTVSNDNLDINKLLLLWSIFEPIIFKMLPDHRRSNEFTSSIRDQVIEKFYYLNQELEETEEYEDHDTKVQKYIQILEESIDEIRGGNTKYLALNVKSQNMVEFRCQASTINCSLIEGWVKFCLELVTGSLTFDLDKIPDDYIELFLIDIPPVLDNNFIKKFFETTKLSETTKQFVIQQIRNNYDDYFDFTPTPLTPSNEKSTTPTTPRTPRTHDVKQNTCSIDDDKCDSDKICIEFSKGKARCVPKNAYEAIMYILNEIPGMNKIPNLNFTTYEGIIQGTGTGESIEKGIQFWNCDKKPYKCIKSTKPTSYIEENDCIQNCDRKKKGKKKDKTNKWWNCLDGKCISTNEPGEFSNPFDCYNKCKGNGLGAKQSCEPEALLKGQINIIKGHMQSGKTKFMIGMALRYRLCNISSLIIVNGTADETQLMNRFKEYWEENIIKPLQGKIDIPFPFKLIAVRDIKKIDFVNEPSIMITLADVSHLSKIYSLIKDNENSKNMVVMIDESDYLDSTPTDLLKYKESKNIEEIEGIVKNYNDTARIVFMDLIKHIVFSILLVSATILDNTLKDDIYSKNIIIIDPPKNYKGIQDLICIEIPKDSQRISLKSLKAKANEYDEYAKTGIEIPKSTLFETDKFLLKYLEEFNTQIHQQTTFGTIPNITLIKNTTFVGPQYELYEFIKQNLTNIIPIVWTGDILNVYLGNTPINTTITDTNIKNALTKATINQIGNYKEFKFKSSQGIGVILEWLKYITVRGKNIVIIAPNFGDRGISFAAGSFPRWHLTQMYYIPSDGTSQPDLLQATGRLCGNIDDDIPLNLYVKKTTCEDIHKAYKIQEYLLNLCEKISIAKIEEKITMRDILEGKLSVPDELISKIPIISKAGKIEVSKFDIPENADFRSTDIELELKHKNILDKVKRIFDTDSSKYKNGWLPISFFGDFQDDLEEFYKKLKQPDNPDKQEAEDKKGIFMVETKDGKVYIRNNS